MISVKITLDTVKRFFSLLEGGVQQRLSKEGRLELPSELHLLNRHNSLWIEFHNIRAIGDQILARAIKRDDIRALSRLPSHSPKDSIRRE